MAVRVLRSAPSEHVEDLACFMAYLKVDPQAAELATDVDRTRNVTGVAASLDVQERLVNVVATGITPPLTPAIEVWPWRDKEVIVVGVFPSSSPPHHVNEEGVERGTYVRVFRGLGLIEQWGSGIGRMIDAW